MMKKLTLIIAIVFSGMLMQAQFRNSEWGMTKTEVKQTESLDLDESSNDAIAYKTTFLGLDTYVVYYFNNGKLISAAYAFNNENTHDNDYIDDYHGINELLTKKYGEPDSDEINWKDDSWKNDYSHWGFAVSLGQLEYNTVYKLDKMEIRHFLSGDALKFFHAIKYSDPVYIDSMMKEDFDKL